MLFSNVVSDKKYCPAKIRIETVELGHNIYSELHKKHCPAKIRIETTPLNYLLKLYPLNKKHCPIKIRIETLSSQKPPQMKFS